MGSGIAQVAAMAGHEVILYDAFQMQWRKDATVYCNHSINWQDEKGKITDQEAKTIFDLALFCRKS